MGSSGRAVSYRSDVSLSMIDARLGDVCLLPEDRTHCFEDGKLFMHGGLITA